MCVRRELITAQLQLDYAIKKQKIVRMEKKTAWRMRNKLNCFIEFWPREIDRIQFY